MTLICPHTVYGCNVIVFTTSGTSSCDSKGMSVGNGDSDDGEAPHVAQVHAAPPGPHGML